MASRKIHWTVIKTSCKCGCGLLVVHVEGADRLCMHMMSICMRAVSLGMDAMSRCMRAISVCMRTASTCEYGRIEMGGVKL